MDSASVPVETGSACPDFPHPPSLDMISPPPSLLPTSRTKPAGGGPWQDQMRRMWMASGGGLCVVVGFVFFLFPPIPIGTPLLALGFALLMRSSDPFKRWILVRTRRLPRLHRFLRKVAGRA